MNAAFKIQVDKLVVKTKPSFVFGGINAETVSISIWYIAETVYIWSNAGIVCIWYNAEIVNLCIFDTKQKQLVNIWYNTETVSMNLILCRNS